MARVPREIREGRARELIREHPSWGKDRINRELRGEYGTGLRRIYVARIKGEELYVKPTRVERRYQTLTKEGFLPTEARLLSQNPISSPAMMRYREERKAMVRAGVKSGRPVRAKQIRELYRLEGHWEKGKPKPLARYRGFIRAMEFLPWEELPWARPALTREQNRIYNKLRDAGFLPKEAVEIATAPSMPAAWGTAPVEQAMATRRRWVAMLLSEGWTKRQIRREIENYYRRDPRRSPWDFIRQEYQPRRKVKDFEMAATRRSQVRRAREQAGELYRKPRRRVRV